MEQDLYRVYGDLSKAYAERTLFVRGELLIRYPNVGQGAILIENMIISAREHLEATDKKLRPDAQYFLLTNFHEMVFLPLLLRDGKSDLNNVLKAIEDDIKTILRTASEWISDREISSGDLLRIVAELWDTLKINEIRFWGARDNAKRG